MAEQDLDRNEAATPFKLQKARERGQVARSPEFTASLALLGALAYVSWQAAGMWRDLLQSAAHRLHHLPVEPLSPEAWLQLLFTDFGHGFAIIMPALLAVAGAAALACWLQTGGAISVHPLKPDFSRLNPVQGLRRLWQWRTLLAGGKGALKVAVLALVAVLSLRETFPKALELAWRSPSDGVAQAGRLGLALAWRLGLAVAAIACLEVLAARWQFARQMRMSRREMKDEHRHREGDPRIRSRLRQLRAELLQRSRSLRNTAGADLVLTNPTHYAVALRYEHGRMDAPQLVAKGAGLLAAAMRALAARHGVAVVPSPALTRGLFRTMRIDDTLPTQFHAEVARIFVWVFANRQRQARTGGAS